MHRACNGFAVPGADSRRNRLVEPGFRLIAANTAQGQPAWYIDGNLQSKGRLEPCGTRPDHTTVNDLARIQRILDYWFGELDAAGMAGPAQQTLWFNPPAGTDEAIRDQFRGDVELALTGALDHWRATPQGLLALVILLDQFTRNIYRGTPAAFSGDSRALALARAAVARQWHCELATIHGVFLCMPFEHAEDPGAQDEGLAAMDGLLSRCPAEARSQVADFRRYLLAHREVIARFGRFPHRNAILGRASTPAELSHLETHRGF
jgi:uncharacterized protein (DUF924 family)